MRRKNRNEWENRATRQQTGRRSSPSKATKSTWAWIWTASGSNQTMRNRKISKSAAIIICLAIISPVGLVICKSRGPRPHGVHTWKAKKASTCHRRSGRHTALEPLHNPLPPPPPPRVPQRRRSSTAVSGYLCQTAVPCRSPIRHAYRLHTSLCVCVS